MDTVARINLKELRPEEREELELFTEPPFRCCLKGQDPNKIPQIPIVAVGSPKVGLALASVYKELNFALVHSVQSKDNNENQILKILEVLEEELIKEGAETATFKFFDEGKRSEPLWSALKKQKWAEPELFILKYYLYGKGFHPPWLKKQHAFPQGFEEFSWLKLTQYEKNDLLSKIKSGKIPLNVSPFGENENIIEPVSSLGLRHKGKVIGWIVTHRIAHDVVSFTYLYVEPEYKFTGIPIRLLADSINLQIPTNVKWGVFDINIDQSSASWLAFLEKRLAPYSHGLAKMYKTWKTL